MARLPRFSIPGLPQHVIQRGNNRDVIFVADDDYLFYLEKLNNACQKFQCQIHAYVLMTNHVHLLMTPHSENSISRVMQSLGRYYVQYFNFQYDRTGTLWEGRYKATLLDSEQYLLICSRYIELNPVRANMVSHASEYPWSSYRCNAMGKDNVLITPHPIYKRLGSNDAERQYSYKALFNSKMSHTDIEDIREATNKAWVLGNDRFKEKIETLSARQVEPKARGGDRRSEDFKEKAIKRV
ncbi:MAG: transposase [Gammaproteobacteria bacterium]|nr:transposase [Gammaproteobacteria bacterium]